MRNDIDALLAVSALVDVAIRARRPGRYGPAGVALGLIFATSLGTLLGLRIGGAGPRR